MELEAMSRVVRAILHEYYTNQRSWPRTRECTHWCPVLEAMYDACIASKVKECDDLTRLKSMVEDSRTGALEVCSAIQAWLQAKGVEIEIGPDPEVKIVGHQLCIGMFINCAYVYTLIGQLIN